MEKILSCDIEIAFTDVSFQELVALIGNNCKLGYSCEDKVELGWGSVIARDEESFGYRQELSSFLFEFLKDLSDSINTVRKAKPSARMIVRVGVYYETYSFTLNLDLQVINALHELGVELEVSIYPAGE